MTRKPSKRQVAGWLAAACGLAIWARWRPLRVEVEGHSMSPVLEPGDWLVAFRTGRPNNSAISRAVQVRPTHGRMVVVEHPERSGFELVKRIVGVPGDRIGALLLEDGRYWVAGTRPEESADSRWFGPVGAERIRGIVVLRYWPPRRIAWLL